jgi:hypothetical protein
MSVLTVSAGGVPVGSYVATFAGAEPQPENKERGYPAGLRWKFTIDNGPQAGQTASRITSTAPSLKNPCGKILSGLLGRALKEGEPVNPDDYVGRKYLIVVAAGQGGGTRVEAVAPA